jgi:hypothetical protein
MKKNFVLAFIFCYSVCVAQHSYQNANSIIVNSNNNKNEASAETSFEFNHFQLTGIYNISEKIFIHSNLKLNVLQQQADKFFGSLLGANPIMLHNDDVGAGLGFGLQNIGKIGKLNMQLVFGYDYEKQKYTFNEKRLDANDNLVDSVSNQNNALYKISSNFNLIKTTDRYNTIYLLRLSYCQFTKYEYNNTDIVMSKSGFPLAEPAVQIDFKLLKNRSLFITTQFGLSLPLSSLEYSYSANLPFEATTDTKEALLDIILKLGVKYNFIKK